MCKSKPSYWVLQALREDRLQILLPNAKRCHGATATCLIDLIEGGPDGPVAQLQRKSIILHY